MKILVVEDEQMVAQDIMEILESKGYEVYVSHSYEEAKTMIMEVKPELVLSDINLGSGKDGIDLIQELRKEKITLEVVYLTANSDNDTLTKVEGSRPVNFLVKPYNETQLYITIKLAENYLSNKYHKDGDLSQLTHTELKILELIAQNKTSKEISKELFVTEKTIRNHRYNISKKLDLSQENNSLLRWAVQRFK